MNTMCGVQLKDSKRFMDLMFMLGLMTTYIGWLWLTMFIGMIMCCRARMVMC